MALFGNIKIPRTYHLIDTPKNLSWLVDELMKAPEMAYDIENTNCTVKNKDKQRRYNREATIKVAGVSFAWGRKGVQTPWEPGNAAYIPLIKSDESDFWGRNQQAVLRALKTILENDVPKVAHNGKFDSRELYRRLGICTKNFWFDTMLAHALLDEDRLECSHALKSDYDKQGKMTKLGLSDKYLDIGSSDFKLDLGDALTHYDPTLRRYHKVPLDTLYPYACADSDFTLSLRYIFTELLSRENLQWVFQNISMPLSHAIMLLEIHGVPLNIDKARQVEMDQKVIMADNDHEIQRLIGKEFNVASTKQLGEALFEHLQLPGGVRNRNGWVVDADTIAALDHPVKEPLAKYRRAQQIQSTYATPAIDLIDEITNDGKVGWVHPQIWLDSVTGRLKCQDPNLTNLPKVVNGGDIVKGMWQGGEDYVFLFKDFSQMELRVTAHCSQEPVWVNGFKRGEDMHSAMAKAINHLDCPVEEVAEKYKKERGEAKNINFGILYGESEWALSQKLGISYEEAVKLVQEDYFGAAPVLKQWIDYVHNFAQENGYITNMFQRRRHLPDAQLIPPIGLPKPGWNDRMECYTKGVKPRDLNIPITDLHNVDETSLSRLIKSNHQTRFFKCVNCPNLRSCFVNSEVRYIEQTKKRALRQSVNTIIQGSAADMSSLALIWITKELKDAGLRSSPILYIHDEIGCYTHVDDVEKVDKIMEDCMTARLLEFTGFTVPLVTDTEVVKCWGDKK